MGDAAVIATVADWRAEHREHDVVREVVHVVHDPALAPGVCGSEQSPALEISLYCRDCGESIRMDLG